jgi:membrane protease YdiL (CAAX protease family)
MSAEPGTVGNGPPLANTLPDGESQTPGRAGLALLLLVPAPSIGVLAAMWGFLPGEIGRAIYVAMKLWALLLPALWWLAVERGKPSWSPPRRGGLGTGLGLGIAMGVAVLAAYLIFGEAWIDELRFREAAAERGMGTRERYMLLAIYLITINSALEEYVWRWFVLSQCEVFLPGRAAVLLAALLFTIHHLLALRAQVPWNATLLACLGVFAGGAVWSWCYLRYRSIWPGYVSHAIVDISVLAAGWDLLFGFS